MKIASPSFWKGKKVFVTGDTGFKGSWLSIWLNKMGAEVRGFSYQPPHTEPNLYDLAYVKDLITHMDGDVRRGGELFTAIQMFKPEVVFHLAAQAIVWKAYENPAFTFMSNVMGTVNVLEACRQAESVQSLVCVTSDKCYDNKEWLWGYREIDPLGGNDPYAASKAAAEMAIAGYRHYFGGHKVVASARAGNVIGGGDWAPDRLIPDIVRALQKGEPIVLRHPEATRPWQHVLEPLNGYLLLAESMQSGPWNFGPDKANIHSVGDVVGSAIQTWGKGSFTLDTTHEKDFHENTFLGLDSTKANRVLGWQPVWNFHETMQHTISWYRDVLVGGRKAIYSCLEDIEEYVGDL